MSEIQRFGANISFPYTEKKVEEPVILPVITTEETTVEASDTKKKVGALKINEK